MRVPISTYRLQLNSGFTFHDAHALVGYLDALGVTDVYASPFLKASPGSLHGYDICDHGRLNPEIGDDNCFAAWAAALAEHEMGLILDFVPNHMGLDSRTNVWWRSVLTHGPSSPFAGYFDIDWHPLTPELRSRVLLPILQDGYGDSLERGDLQLAYDGREFIIRYFDRELPLDPKSLAPLLQEIAAHDPQSDGAPWAERVQVVLDVLTGLPDFRSPSADDPNRRSRMSAHAAGQLAQAVDEIPGLREHIERVMSKWNGTRGNPHSFDPLHELLEQQPYRLACWRTAFDEINYRRFFDVNDLGGLSMEDQRVFDDAHHLVLRLLGNRQVTGLRIDHPDGLFDPDEYFRRLQDAARPITDGDQMPGADREALYVLAEKILTNGETLPESWQVAGTTGYGFMNALNGLFVDGDKGRAVIRAYEHVVNRRDAFKTIRYQAKRLIMTSSLASELAVLTRALKHIASSDRTSRDFTLNALQRALIETVACFPVYRTYVTWSGFSAADRDAIDVATDEARRLNPVMPSAVFLFLRGVLLAEASRAPSAVDPTEWLAPRRAFAMKFQQFSAPVEAKGVEDTAFYRYVPLLSLNEVGGDPARFGRSPDEFHSANQQRLERFPFEMNATSTHDSKRGEDARARINAISELPEIWRHAVSSWMRINAKHRSVVEREPAPDRNDEYLYYQSLLGIWPAEAMTAPIPAVAPADIVERMRGYMQKAIKEAKRHTSWISQNTGYDDAVVRFVESTLTGTGARTFLGHFVPLARRFSAIGMINSLAQVMLKLVSPGIPDFYQGTELWHLALADPDNRRPVDFFHRRALLEELCPWLERSETHWSTDALLSGRVREWMQEWPDGRIKMFVTACGLRLRRRARELMWRGQYSALAGSGERASNVIGVMRSSEHEHVVAVGPRLLGSSLWNRPWPLDDGFWGDTLVNLPREFGAACLKNIVTGESVRVRPTPDGPAVAAADAFRICPAAMLWATA